MSLERMAALSAALTVTVAALPLGLGASTALAAGAPKSCGPVQTIESKYLPIKSIKTEHLGTGATDCLITLKSGGIAATNMEAASMSLYNEVRATSASMFKVVNLKGVGKAGFVAYSQGKPAGADALSKGNVIYALTDNLSAADDTAILKALVKLG